MEIGSDMLISTSGWFKCSYPMYVVDHLNKTIYSWNSVDNCNYIYIVRQSSCTKRENTFESITLNHFCRNMVSINLNSCRAFKGETLQIHENTLLIKNIGKYRQMFEFITLKTKIIIGIVIHTILLLIALVFTRNRRYYNMTIKICKDAKTECFNIKSPCEISTKVRFFCL
ncbi:hypothetical protein OIY81_251 [Cryptosporidium canis]|uniref:Uncharacterized protein n=1 Tax=Cryptosporidium canis TaxID=195482 RepID=A0ABQ8P2F9_9CRYT|nr:hypothetical protein OJ252_3412 [Cryptosporidium canis]KAJ1614802.1 hypothetical protein OIY81_251 [Cryptosporidium canis]